MDADTLAAALAQVLRETTDGTTRNSGRNHAAKPEKYDGNRAAYDVFKRSGSVVLLVETQGPRFSRVLNNEAYTA